MNEETLNLIKTAFGPIDISPVTDEEHWAEIPGYAGHYEVSTLGNVRRLAYVKTLKDGRTRRYQAQPILPTQSESSGIGRGTRREYVVSLTDENGKAHRERVHLLVARTFLPRESLEGMQVNHIDGNSLNNRLSNLEWVTDQENKAHEAALAANNRSQRIVLVSVRNPAEIHEMVSMRRASEFLHRNPTYVKNCLQDGKDASDRLTGSKYRIFTAEQYEKELHPFLAVGAPPESAVPEGPLSPAERERVRDKLMAGHTELVKKLRTQLRENPSDKTLQELLRQEYEQIDALRRTEDIIIVHTDPLHNSTEQQYNN